MKRTNNITVKWETGASSHQANNLVLSVLSDGAVYQDRLHCGYAMLQGASHRLTIRDIVQAEANKQRTMGCTFPAKSISEAVKLITARTIDDCFTLMRDEWDGFNITATCRRWFDKVNGNSYFSVRLSIPTATGCRWLSVPFQYGYGDQWQDTAVIVLRKIGFDIPDAYYSEMPIDWNDEGYMQKRMMFAGVKL